MTPDQQTQWIANFRYWLRIQKFIEAQKVVIEGPLLPQEQSLNLGNQKS
jgi:hypothetical protein